MKRKNKKSLNEQKVIKGQGWILDRNLTTDELFIKKRNVAAFWAACQHYGKRIKFFSFNYLRSFRFK